MTEDDASRKMEQKLREIWISHLLRQHSPQNAVGEIVALSDRFQDFIADHSIEDNHILHQFGYQLDVILASVREEIRSLDC